ncbi:leptin receptor [Acanthochromis polyacanthus]|uniref:leptin receptor n=1 Tax=Acanthochromis polyacanthus TaxID=80966 RepID=UPI0022346B16|nr:leptin receptor [Acanthochromis polyacanthus]
MTTTTMVRSVVLTVLMHVFLVPHDAQSLEPEDGASFPSGALGLPWQDELCCDSPSAHPGVEGGATNTSEANRSESTLPLRPRCKYRNSTTQSHPYEPSGGTCVDIRCRIDENSGNLTCDLQSHGHRSGTLDVGLMMVRLQRLLSQKTDAEVNNPAPDSPVVCEAKDSFMCSITLDPTTSFVTMVTVSILDAVAPPVLLRIPARPVKPSPPVNVSHIQTIEAELIVQWNDSTDFDLSPLRYEVRFSSNTTHPTWQVVHASGKPQRSLDLKPKLNYTIQVRCCSQEEPPLWSEWSEPHHIYLNKVSYIPDKIVVRRGENVTVCCVFNDHSINASTAVWMLNHKQPLNHSQYHPVNQWVSQITVRPSETQMYDVLRCTKEWTLAYSQIYLEGAVINIRCKTDGDMNAMHCSWNDTQLTMLTFRSSWSYLSCDEMKKREKAGKTVGEMGPVCRSSQKTCTIKPLRMTCYKLWLEVPSPLGPIRSEPFYVFPQDHVKPNPPTDVKAVSQRNGHLNVTWKPPSLPVEVQCQFRYHSPSAVSTAPDWKNQSSVRVPWDDVLVPDMCRGYVVQVRCIHVKLTGEWSDWSASVYSTPQNSRAPERPDFWRIFQDDPHSQRTNVTLLFEPLPVSGNSYCVDGFIVQWQTSGGPVTRKRIELVSSYSFEWNQELQIVTVEAYNTLGSSTNNINMTLKRQPKRRCVRSFHVLVINSTCVSLSWSLLDNRSVPQFMVVQWWPQRQQDSQNSEPSGETWARLPYTDHPVFLTGNFIGSEKLDFSLYPVFADEEGEPFHTSVVAASRGDPAVYMLLMIISFLSIVLFITLLLSQNQMKKFMWKDVPNPKKCSWAKGIDLKKADTFDHLFQPPEGLPMRPLLLPSENISKVIIVDKALAIQTSLVSLTPDPTNASATSLPPGFDSVVDQFIESETLTSAAVNLDDLITSSSEIDELLPADPPEDQHPGNTDTSAQSSVTYATVLFSHPKQDLPPVDLHYKDGGSSSSSDEGNFSANNSDISGSFTGGLWELDSCRGGDMDDPRRSRSYNSVEELSEPSEQEDEGEVRPEKDLCYLGMDYPAEDDKSKDDEEQREEETTELLKSVVLNRENCSMESHPLLGPEDSSGLLSPSTCNLSLLYLPQFRTAACMRQFNTQTQDSKPPL